MVFSSMAAANEAEKLTVVSLGDSITFGWNLEPNQTAQSQKAFPFLIGTGSNEVLNVSYPGWTSTQLFEALNNNPASGTILQQADVITLNIGANDLMQAVGIGELLRTQQPIQLTPEQILGLVSSAADQLTLNLSKTIQLIRLHTDAPILLYSIYNPFAASTDPFLGSLHLLGEEITKNVNQHVIGPVAAQSGSIYLDAYAAFNGNQQNYIIQGDIHPTIAGHQALAQLATNALIALRPKEITIDEPIFSTEEETSEPVVVTIGKIEDAELLKWLPGEKSKEDFAQAGNVVNDNSFEVTENGKYTIYAKTTSGSEAIKVIHINNIIPKEEKPFEEEAVTEEPEVTEPPIVVVEPVDTTPDEVEQPKQELTKNEETLEVEKTEKPTIQTGHTLPNTATSMYSFLVAGLCLVGVGGGMFITQRTRKSKIDNTLN
jgi:LPXTG-motif cell wall-anchored protein